MLIYQGLDFKVPTFGHMSLILAPDKSKLSKRHGATSVGDFRERPPLGRPPAFEGVQRSGPHGIPSRRPTAASWGRVQCCAAAWARRSCRGAEHGCACSWAGGAPKGRQAERCVLSRQELIAPPCAAAAGEQGYLPAAMNNYLSLLGWNDGTEQVRASLLPLAAPVRRWSRVCV
jgi:hypothetical protein